MTCRSEYVTLLLLLVTSCGREAQHSVDLVALSTDSAGIRLITLSHGPEQWPSRVVLRADTPSVMRTWEFGAAIDVAPMSDGAVAVLDALAKQIVIFDSANGASTISRAGAGPGELQMTMAMEAAGSQLLVWQLPRQGNTVLAVLNRSGRVVATAASPVEGDWSRPLLRAPRLDVDGFQRGPEDVTRRIAAIGDSALMVMIQDNEASNSREAGVPEESRPRTHVLLLDTSLSVVDTIAVLAGPVTRPQNTTDRFRYMSNRCSPAVRSSRPEMAGSRLRMATPVG